MAGKRHTNTGRSQQEIPLGAVLELRAQSYCHTWLERERVKERPRSSVSPSFF